MKPRWKGPTIKEIADLAGVGSASVDRVLNNRPGVKEKTRVRVMAALEKLNYENAELRPIQAEVVCASGVAFNDAMRQAIETVNRTSPGAQLTGHFVSTAEINPALFARQILEAGDRADGVIVVAHEHPAINRAIRDLVAKGVPVICATSDLPSSRRSAYVGNDQYAAGSVAAQLIGQILPEERRSILLVMSAPFRSQQEREMGFRRVLRTVYPHLLIEERVVSDDDPVSTQEHLSRAFETGPPPAAIYNVAGANRGVAGALQAHGLGLDTVFVGHELTRFSRTLLDSGVMDYVISHDFTAELNASVQAIRDRLDGITTDPAPSSILIHTRYN